VLHASWCSMKLSTLHNSTFETITNHHNNNLQGKVATANHSRPSLSRWRPGSRAHMRARWQNPSCPARLERKRPHAGGARALVGRPIPPGRWAVALRGRKLRVDRSRLCSETGRTGAR
jgi:hypothetical protein